MMRFLSTGASVPVLGSDWRSSSDFLNRYSQQHMRSWSFSQAAAFPISLASSSMAADDYNPVSLRNKSKKKSSRGGNVTMSRRRISVKELGQPDHQGWLYRKKDAFLGIKWKKYWFVLKKTSLYWYNNQLAERAEGFINLTDFIIDRAIECKKKHAIKACHPHVMMFFFAAESHQDMNIWLNKLGLASIKYESTEKTAATECYSEASDPEEGETPEAPPPPYCEETLRNSVAAASPPASGQDTLPPPYSSPLPDTNGSLSSPVSTMTSQSSASSLVKNRQSWLDLVSQASPVATETTTTTATTTVVCSVQVHMYQSPQEELGEEEADEASASPQEASTGDLSESSSHGDVRAAAEGQTQVDLLATGDKGGHEANSDEMEELYIHLKQASLSPIGVRKPSTKKDFRASFIKRCRNQTVNDKLHLIRTLNSTLKSKESDLQVIDQVLSAPELTSDGFREWKEAHSTLFQEICLKEDQQVAPEDEEPITEAANTEAATTETASAVAAPLVETSL
ncbi:Interactor protein for cytohesin exchange factors 1 [Merluccius polli]|uniref:Interactor protein for cytohesin exchange factors 1 n=1 Tax=Merluccius polli TaxID=89951 RepID=A0AA47M1H9_MERPO|nr:Interactor protein for cytohesin exchange factors 1 [Merluccius polli]